MMVRNQFFITIVSLGIFTAVTVSCSSENPINEQTPSAISDPLYGGIKEGFARATEVQPLQFPHDHGPHPNFGTEWWYFTGNLESEEGRRFGYELALFRIGLKPGRPHRPSHWATQHVYMGHFALTDVANGQFHFHERFARNAAGLAGARPQPFAVWLEDWSVHALPANDSVWTLRAAADGVSVALELNALKPIVLHGDRGLSQKSAELGNASYYYSITRLATRGTVTVGDDQIPVSGTSWMDREWSTSALSAEQAGWDWFGLQLSDDSELMFYRLRRHDGNTDTHSSGTWVNPQGQAYLLRNDNVVIDALDTWSSPRGDRYPSRLRLTVKSLDLTLDVTPVLANQELDVSVRYWEGAVDVRGRRAGKSLTGRGYMELTGYGETDAAQ